MYVHVDNYRPNCNISDPSHFPGKIIQQIYSEKRDFASLINA